MSKGTIAIVLLVLAFLTGCAGVRDTVEAGAACLRTERCWR